MADKRSNSIDPATGTITYNGPSVSAKSDHSHMPLRTDAYLPTDERGHIQASCLGGANGRDNIVPQSADLNHGGYYNMERSERALLDHGAAIHSEKIAFAGNQPGNRPDAFMVNDTVTYADGRTQDIHLSFANIDYAAQEEMNRSLDSYSDMLDGPNPGDGLRASLSVPEYAELMEETDRALPDIGQLFDEQISVSFAEDTDRYGDYDSSPNMADTGDPGPTSADAAGTDDGADISTAD